MAAQILDGSAVSKQIRAELAERVERLKAGKGIIPHLAVILVGSDPASVTYTRMKERASQSVGMAATLHRLSENAGENEILALLQILNDDPKVHGILVQHPLPKHLDETKILSFVSPGKDVDGISVQSLGQLLVGQPKFSACTPVGIIELLDSYDISIEGQEAVVVGRSIILGKPMALLLLNRNATVTICHSKTRDLPEVTRRADILVAAVGRAEMIKGDWIKEGAVVVDAGYNRVPGRERDVGDVDFESAKERASYITPVPGGVGPMTITMLLKNTIVAAESYAETGSA